MKEITAAKPAPESGQGDNKMYKIFIPQVSKHIKQNTRGLWLSPQNKLYYDYFTTQDQDIISYCDIEALRIKYKQECIFYIDCNVNKAYVFYNSSKIEVLNNYLYIIADKSILKQTIKLLLKQYRGLTITKLDNHYIIEVYYND